VLDGFHAALYVSIAAALLGIVAMTVGRRAAVEAPVAELPQAEILEEAA
jgi:hypothetical protein